MKTRLFTLFVGTFAIMISGKAIAQDTNPYSVFGFKIDGGISTSAEKYTPPVQYVEIENPDETSPVARLRFFPKTNMAQYMGKNGEVLYEEHWKENQYKWLTMDPKATKYYSISPYVYALNNPVRYIDPKGEDVWEFDNMGNVLNHIKTKEHDAFYMMQQVDGAWQRTGQQMVFEYGTVTGYRTPTREVSDGLGGSTTQQYTIFEMKGDNNATQLFEFMANPGTTTNVEWTHAKVGTESSGRNIIGTSHNQSSTAVGSYVLNTGYTIREVNHNHPSGVPLPSGGDMTNAGNYLGRFPNAGLNIYVPTSGYSTYNGSGTLDSRVAKMPDGSYILPDGRHVRTR